MYYVAEDYVNSYDWAYDDFIVTDARGIRDATVVLHHTAQIGDPMFATVAERLQSRSTDPAVGLRRVVKRMEMITDLSEQCPNLKGELRLSPAEKQTIRAGLSKISGNVRTWHAPTGGAKMPVVQPSEDLPLVLEIPLDCRNAMGKRFGVGAYTINLRFLPLHFQLDQPRQLGASPDASVLIDVRELELLRQALRDAVILTAVPLRLRIHGYADRLGEQADNQALSQRRAEWLRRQIQADPALRPIRDISARGCGDDLAPLSPERNPKYRVAIARLEPGGSTAPSR